MNVFAVMPYGVTGTHLPGSKSLLTAGPLKISVVE